MESDRELGFTPTYKLGELIRTKSISPVELTESHLRRADVLDPQLGIFITRISDMVWMRNPLTVLKRHAIMQKVLSKTKDNDIPENNILLGEGLQLQSIQ